MRLTAAFLMVLLSATSSPAAETAEKPALTFEAGVEIVNLSVAVSGGGRCVTDLDLADFEVFEDGIRQQLSVFDRANLPTSVVLMIDASDSMSLKMPAARTAAARLVDNLGDEDEVQVVQFSNRAQILQEFTRDKQAGKRAIEAVEVGGATTLYDTLYVTLKDLVRESRKAERRRRYAIVMLSDGKDTVSLGTDDQVLDLARRTEIAIHTVSLPDPNRILDALDWGRVEHFLKTLAHDSGGSSHFPSALAELDAVYARIADELRGQYSLAYVPSNSQGNGKWRRIAVLIRGRRDVSVRHKTGYYAPRPRSTAGR